MHTVRHHNKHSVLCATASDSARTIVSQEKWGFKQQRHSGWAAMCLHSIQGNWEGLKWGAQGTEDPSERGHSSFFERISLYSCWSIEGNYHPFTTVDLGALLLVIFGMFFVFFFLPGFVSTHLGGGLRVCGLFVWQHLAKNGSSLYHLTQKRNEWSPSWCIIYVHARGFPISAEQNNLSRVKFGPKHIPSLPQCVNS